MTRLTLQMALLAALPPALSAQRMPSRIPDAVLWTVRTEGIDPLEHVVLERTSLESATHLSAEDLAELRRRVGGRLSISKITDDSACLAAAKGPDTGCEVIQIGSYRERGDTVRVNATWHVVGPDGNPAPCSSAQEFIVTVVFTGGVVTNVARDLGISSDQFCESERTRVRKREAELGQRAILAIVASVQQLRVPPLTRLVVNPWALALVNGFTFEPAIPGLRGRLAPLVGVGSPEADSLCTAWSKAPRNGCAVMTLDLYKDDRDSVLVRARVKQGSCETQTLWIVKFAAGEVKDVHATPILEPRPGCSAN